MAYREFYEAPIVAPEPLDLSEGLAAVANQLRFNSQLEAQKEAAKQKRQADNMKKYEDMSLPEVAERDELYIHENYYEPKTDKIIGLMNQGLDWTHPMVVQEVQDMERVAAASNSFNAFLKDTDEKIKNYPEWIEKGVIKKTLYDEATNKNVDERDVSSLTSSINPMQNTDIVNTELFTKNFMANFEQQKVQLKKSIESQSGQRITDEEISSQMGLIYDKQSGQFVIPDDKKKDMLDQFYNYGGELGGNAILKKHQQAAENQILSEAKQYAARQKTLTGIDLDPKQLAAEWAENPDKNPINPKAIGERVHEMGEKAILSQANAAYKRSYTYNLPGDQTNKGNTRGSGRSGVSYTDSLFNPVVNSAGMPIQIPFRADLPRGVSVVGMAVSENGKPVKVQTGNPNRYSVLTGDKESTTIGNQDFHMVHAGISAFDRNGKPVIYNEQIEDPEDFVSLIENKPDSWFADKKSELRPTMTGYVADKNNILNEVNKVLDETEEGLRNNVMTMSSQEKNNAERLRTALVELRTALPNVQTSEELIDLLAKDNLGVLETRMHQVIQANDNDLAQIQLATGRDMRDRSSWSPEWLKADEVWKNRYARAKANNFGRKEQQTPSQQQQKTQQQSSSYSTGGAY